MGLLAHKKSYVVKEKTIHDREGIAENKEEQHCDSKDKMNLIYLIILAGLLAVVCGKCYVSSTSFLRVYYISYLI